MNVQDKAALESVITAFAKSITLLSIQIEQQCEGGFQRVQFAGALRDAARMKPGGSKPDQIQIAILENIAAQAIGQSATPVHL